MIDSNRRSKRLCRDHLLKEFKREFLNFEEKRVVFYPALETKNGPYFYQYQAMSDIPKKMREDNVGQRIRRALHPISGNCRKCGRSAHLAYLGPGTFRWEVVKTGGVECDLPKFEEMTAEPEILCNSCVVDQLIYSLRNFSGHFSEGIVLPYKGEGVFLPGIA